MSTAVDDTLELNNLGRPNSPEWEIQHKTLGPVCRLIPRIRANKKDVREMQELAQLFSKSVELKTTLESILYLAIHTKNDVVHANTPEFLARRLSLIASSAQAQLDAIKANEEPATQ